ncbi:MAG TPA: phosphopantetheine-binding protein [Thermoanaerobaculia bacterium]|nr:phosphopantetheine-binding protein [Thermoanaerobaculia bacterium]
MTRIVADALEVSPDEVGLHSSLLDDLDAESIDFIDIVFRLESAFNIMVPTDELWAGSQKVDPNDPDSLARAVSHLRASMPEFAWERFPTTVTKRDLPRLMTVSTISAYLHSHLASEAAAKR